MRFEFKRMSWFHDFTMQFLHIHAYMHVCNFERNRKQMNYFVLILKIGSD